MKEVPFMTRLGLTGHLTGTLFLPLTMNSSPRPRENVVRNS